MLGREPDFEVFGYKGYKRPHLDIFLSKLANSYVIAVWSSAGNEYVNSIIDKLNLQIEFKIHLET
jgi:TFIIF-interacting CTD phosphatase-like protein